MTVLASALAVAALGWSAAASAEPDALRAHRLAKEDERVDLRLRTNQFGIRRDQKGYAQQLGLHFLRDVATWHSQMKILDAGAGTASFLRELLDAPDGAGQAELVAVGVSKPDDEKLEAALAEHRNFRYLEGRLGEQRAIEAEIGPGSVDRIVDVYGASHYTRKLDALLASYGRLLKPGGRAYLHFDLFGSHYRPGQIDLTKIGGPDGEPVGLVRWLEAARGLRVRYAGVRHRRLQLVVERTRQPLSIPALELHDLRDGRPPHRDFQLVEPLPGQPALPFARARRRLHSTAVDTVSALHEAAGVGPKKYLGTKLRRLRLRLERHLRERD